MRGQIKAVATELLIRHGVPGLRFGDVADRLAITRANIHYHFGTKRNLVEEVVQDYVTRTLDDIGVIWRDPDLGYQEKARRMMEFNRARYAKYNPDGQTGHPWSLISRMRLEADQLTPTTRAALRSFTTAIEGFIESGVDAAVEKGELMPRAPRTDIAVQLIAIVDSAGSITQDGGSFDRLERLYTAYLHIIDHAYGAKPKPAAARSLAKSA
jgi:TetR/AcrR family transcriptional regulator, transcriptional repressor for nem operon